MTRKHTLTNGDTNNHHQMINSDSHNSLILFFDSNDNLNKNGNNINGKMKDEEEEKKSNNDNDEDCVKILDLTTEFTKINDRVNDTVSEMNKYCTTLQELFQLKTKLGKQLIKFVKYHWK